MESVKNIFKYPLEDKMNCHGGKGMIKQSFPFRGDDLESALKFITYSVLPPGTSIGIHTHGRDEEVYCILEGKGTMHLDGENRPVEKGDIILNRPRGTHGLENTGEEDLLVLVFESAFEEEGDT